MNLRAIIPVCCALFTAATWAHGVSTSYIQLTTSATDIHAQIDLSLRDLDAVIDLDPDRNGNVTWGELNAARSDIEQYIAKHVELRRGDQLCQLHPQDLLTDTHADGPYAVVQLNGACQAAGALQVRADLLYEADPTQRTLLNLRNGVQSFTSVLSDEQRTWTGSTLATDQTLRTDTPTAWLSDLRRFVEQGVWHIWTGYDHLAFLLLLLLPAAIRRNQESHTHLFKRLLTVVTAFTVAHSLTLALAALSYVQLPTRLTESGIAASIVLSGFINLHSRARNHGAWAAFGFGLVHGFGFASALADLQLDTGNRITTLFGFNAGVELGQLVIVCAALPLLLWLRRSSWYPRIILPACSLSLSALGTLWFWQRAFG